MEEIKLKLDQSLSWSGKSVKNFAISQVVAISIMFLGYIMLFSIPGWVVKSATESAQNAITVAETTQSNIAGRDQDESPWFELKYVSMLPDKFEAVKTNLETAKILLGNNSFGADQRLADAKEAERLAELASTYLLEIITTLDQNKSQQETAFALSLSIEKDIGLAFAAYELIQTRFNSEMALYHPKYTTPLSDYLEDTTESDLKARDEWALANNFLPPIGANDHTGDPILAIEHFDKAKIEVDRINTLMEHVTAGLDYQALTMREAGPKTQNAIGALSSADEYVFSIQQSTGYWLNDAVNKLVTANFQLELAQTTLNTLLDGYVDYPVAYEAAVASLGASASAESSADTEVETARLAKSDLITLVTLARTAKTTVENAELSQVTLDTKHSNSAWLGVATNVSQANSLITSANGRVETASGYVSLDTQRFFEAYEQTQLAIGELNTATILGQNVVTTASNLEWYRVEWPSAESRASSAIEAERSRVNSYGSYSYSAKNDFDRAESLLSSARSNASSRKFEPAVNDANSAATTVYGTGNRAYGAYEDYQEEQERQRRAAEEAAQRAAEEAARQAQEDSSCCDYDYDSGGSSGGGSDSDYGGGSDSDYGGGSDSDYGGGSDSDYGGGSDSDW